MRISRLMHLTTRNRHVGQIGLCIPRNGRAAWIAPTSTAAPSPAPVSRSPIAFQLLFAVLPSRHVQHKQARPACKEGTRWLSTTQSHSQAVCAGNSSNLVSLFFTPPKFTLQATTPAILLIGTRRNNHRISPGLWSVSGKRLSMSA